MALRRALPFAIALTVALAGCPSKRRDADPSPAASASSVASAPSASSVVARSAISGATLARSADGKALFVADEVHRVVHEVPLPLGSGPTRDVSVPGTPAQLAVRGDDLLVTLRDPGALLVLRAGAEIARVALPADASDAWGLAVTKDGTRALVTSAWTHRVSAVDLASAKVAWSVEVAREPRGIVIASDGSHAYVTHLMGADLTRLDGLSGDASDAPRVRRVHLPAGPLRARKDAPEDATLAYAATFSPDGARLFVPRHALNADGRRPWAGEPVVDVMLTADDSPLGVPPARPFSYASPDLGGRDLTYTGGFPIEASTFVGPRAIVYRRSAGTLLVASEGTDALVELDARAIDPAAHRLRSHGLRLFTFQPKAGLVRGRTLRRRSGRLHLVELDDGTRIDAWDDTKELGESSDTETMETDRGVGLERRPTHGAPAAIVEVGPIGRRPGETSCGAPGGVVLSDDERTAWVHCTSTFGVAEVALDAVESADAPPAPARDARAVTITKLADDPLSELAARGRRVFHDAADGFISENMACASCHPEGRDDGHVWSEVMDLVPGSIEEIKDDGKQEPDATYLASPLWPTFFQMVFEWKPVRGFARQTPMLAGRVDAIGPYGWKGRSPGLVSRVLRGVTIHQWRPELSSNGGGYTPNGKPRAEALAAFLREGLVPPPRSAHPLTPEEQHGKALFEDATTKCASCHAPSTGFTDRVPVPFAALPPTFNDKGPVPSPFRDEKDRMFKTPSLLFVGGTPPYLHDGSAATLEELIDKNRDRMGKTSHLSAGERADLVAYLRTL